MIAITKGQVHVTTAFLAGLACGAGAGYLVAHILGRRSFDRRIEAETEALRLHYQNRAAAASAARDHQGQREAALGTGSERYPDPEPRYIPQVADAGSVRKPSEIPGPYREGEDPSAPGGQVQAVQPGQDDHDSADPLDGMPDDDEDAGDDDDEPDPGEEADPGPGQVTARSGEPYVITEPSFFEDEPTYEKLTITWYEGDNVLVDDKSVPVRNVKWTIGEDFSAHYGPGSSDPNIVYVRNPRLGVDFEVVRDGRSFQEVMFSYRREAGAYGNPG